MNDRLIEEARSIAPMSEERDYIESLCDALEEAERRVGELEGALRLVLDSFSDEDLHMGFGINRRGLLAKHRLIELRALLGTGAPARPEAGEGRG